MEEIIPLEFSSLSSAYVHLVFLNTIFFSLSNLVCTPEKVTLYCGGRLKRSSQLNENFT